MLCRYVCLVAYIEHDKLQPLGRAAVLIRFASESEKSCIRPWMQVLGKAADLQLAQYLRVFRVRHVHREQRIDLAEGTEVNKVSVKAHRVHPLALGKSLDRRELLQIAVEDIQAV